MNREKIIKMLRKFTMTLLITVAIVFGGNLNTHQKYSTLSYKPTMECVTTSAMVTGKVTGTNAPHGWYMERLNNLANAHGKQLHIISGYRSIEEQTVLYNNSDKSGRLVAPPGYSRHNAGLAVDVTSEWAKNLTNPELAKYGLHKPMCYENWHIEPLETQGKSTQQLIQQYGRP